MTIPESISVAKIYVRSLAAIVSMTGAIAFGTYLGAVSENIYLAYIAGVVACVLFDKPPVTT